MNPGHVFLSYCREDVDQVRRLHDELTKAGEKVWWDDDVLPGCDRGWEIKEAIRKSCCVVLCFSRNTQSRSQMSLYSQASYAITILREHPPGAIFVIPVRLSECEIPRITIDGSRSLDCLSHLDLFPPEKWDVGVQRLLQAVRTARSKKTLKGTISHSFEDSDTRPSVAILEFHFDGSPEDFDTEELMQKIATSSGTRISQVRVLSI